MRIKASLAHFADAVGYDLEILSPEATAADYLAAVNQFQDEFVAPCKGCDSCCWERIPLTYLDVLAYLADPRIQEALPPGLPALSAFVQQFCHVFGEGPVIDIALKQQANKACLWLDQSAQCCSRHPARTLVCQTFICLPHSEPAGKLRDLLLNIGEDELVRQYLLEAETFAIPLVIHEGKNPSPRLADYPATSFAGKTAYSQVLLRDVLPAELWTALQEKPVLAD